jgi:RNA polymerase sigma-70 factor, ECF subfamily
LDESEAIARLRSGDIGGLEALVRRYQAVAIRAAYLVVRDQASAEDIVQNAFLRAYERIARFDSTRPFGPWFLRSVVNDAVKAATRRGNEVSLDSERNEQETLLIELLADPDPGPEELADRAELHQAISLALDKLSPSQRAAIVFRYYLCLPEADVATRLKCSLGTVKRRLHMARKRLRDQLGAPESNQRASTAAAPSAPLKEGVER